MTLTVVSVAYSMAPVAPDTAGGAEQVLSMLDAALVEAGHRSVVIACRGSRVCGELIATPVPAEPYDSRTRAAACAEQRRALAAVLARERVSVIHMHGLDFDRVLPAGGPATLVTLHLPPSWYPAGTLTAKRPRTFFNCVSRSQRAACPPDVPLLPDIENGVPLLPWRSAPRLRLAAALGRVCPEKGFHLAVQAAKQAGFALAIGGRVFPYPEHRRYWEHELSPLLDFRRRMLGPLGPRERQRLLGRARCLLAPSLAPETSSLVAMEALASGTPVVARPMGALAEIVQHGRTGFLVETVEDMATAMTLLHEIDGATCRRIAEQRFSAARMTSAYLHLYQALTAAGGTPAGPGA